jgi:hypothetical protein
MRSAPQPGPSLWYRTDRVMRQRSGMSPERAKATNGCTLGHPTRARASFVVVVGGVGCILRAPGGPVDLDRYALRVGSRVDQVKRNVRAGVGE